jgi:hypothetical protein
VRNKIASSEAEDSEEESAAERQVYSGAVKYDDWKFTAQSAERI